MPQGQAVNEIAQTIEKTISAGMAGIAAVLAVTMLIIALAVLMFIRGQSKSRDAHNQNQKFMIETFSGVSSQQNERIIQQGDRMTDVLEKNTEAFNRNSDTREANTVALNDWKNAQVQMVEAVRILTSDINSRQGLTEGTVAALGDKVQMLITETRSGNAKMDQLIAAVNNLPSNYEQNAAAIRALIAEVHQTYEIIISTLRPPKTEVTSTPPALQPTSTPEQ